MALYLKLWEGEEGDEISEALMRQRLETRGYRVTKYVYPPGTYFPEHTHAVDKIDVVMSGQLKMQIGGESIILRSGDALEIPRGMLHDAEVLGTVPVVSLDAIKID